MWKRLLPNGLPQAAHTKQVVCHVCRRACITSCYTQHNRLTLRLVQGGHGQTGGQVEWWTGGVMDRWSVSPPWPWCCSERRSGRRTPRSSSRSKRCSAPPRSWRQPETCDSSDSWTPPGARSGRGPRGRGPCNNNMFLLIMIIFQTHFMTPADLSLLIKVDEYKTIVNDLMMLLQAPHKGVRLLAANLSALCATPLATWGKGAELGVLGAGLGVTGPTWEGLGMNAGGGGAAWGSGGTFMVVVVVVILLGSNLSAKLLSVTQGGLLASAPGDGAGAAAGGRGCGGCGTGAIAGGGARGEENIKETSINQNQWIDQYRSAWRRSHRDGRGRYRRCSPPWEGGRRAGSEWSSAEWEGRVASGADGSAAGFAGTAAGAGPVEPDTWQEAGRTDWRTESKPLRFIQ